MSSFPCAPGYCVPFPRKHKRTHAQAYARIPNSNVPVVCMYVCMFQYHVHKNCVVFNTRISAPSCVRTQQSHSYSNTSCPLFRIDYWQWKLLLFSSFHPNKMSVLIKRTLAHSGELAKCYPRHTPIYTLCTVHLVWTYYLNITPAPAAPRHGWHCCQAFAFDDNEV